MTVQIHTGQKPESGDLALCEILTVDATGKKRWYEISLTPDETFADGNLMAGKMTHPARCPIVSDLAYDAARDHFRDLGYEVHGA